jgi:putative endonuclease
MPFTYLLECRDGALCVGTADVLDHWLRLVDEGRGPAPTRPERRRPVRRVWTEEHASRLTARERARQLRGWGRERQRALVEGRLAVPELPSASRPLEGEGGGRMAS